MIICPSAYEGKTEYEIDSSFLQSLKEYDRHLEAYRDNRRQAIVGWATRQGKKVHEFTLERKEGETWTELERRIISKLPEGDIWKRFGSGKAYDDYLAEEAEKATQAKLKESKHHRRVKVKQEADKIVFDHGLRARNVPVAKVGGA